MSIVILYKRSEGGDAFSKLFADNTQFDFINKNDQYRIGVCSANRIEFLYKLNCYEVSPLPSYGTARTINASQPFGTTAPSEA